LPVASEYFNQRAVRQQPENDCTGGSTCPQHQTRRPPEIAGFGKRRHRAKNVGVVTDQFVALNKDRINCAYGSGGGTDFVEHPDQRCLVGNRHAQPAQPQTALAIGLAQKTLHEGCQIARLKRQVDPIEPGDCERPIVHMR
jgi:hypothetical protein